MAFFNKTKQELQAALERLGAAEQAVAELEADFQAIEGSLALGMMTRDGIFQRANDVLLESLGYHRDQLLGQHHRVICTQDHACSEDYIVFWRELVTGHRKQGRFYNLNARGQGVWLEARYLPVVSDKGIVKRIMVLVDSVAVA